MAKVFLFLTLVIFDSAFGFSCVKEDDVCYGSLEIDYSFTMIDPVNGPVYAKDRSLFTVDGDEEVPIECVNTADGWNLTTTNLLTANGKMPGPNIVVYKDQKITIKVKNKLMNEAITMHWHGIDQFGSPAMDGVAFVTQCPILPGQHFIYTFRPRFAGTYWYHSHVGIQREMGLYGAFIVLRRDDDIPPERQYIMQLQEWNHLYDPVARFKANLKGAGNDQKSILINGKGEFNGNNAPLENFIVDRTKSHVFRVIHVGSADTMLLSVPGLKLIVKETDGFPVEPKVVDQIIILPAERYDFELDLQNACQNNYKIIVKILTGSDLKESQNIKGLALLRVTGVSSGNSLGSSRHLLKDTSHLSSRKEGQREIESQNAKCCENRRKNTRTVLNCPFEIYPNSPEKTCVPVSELKSTFTESNVQETRNSETFFLNFAFVGGPSINGRKFIPPTIAALLEPDEVDTKCEGCVDESPCSCTHTIDLSYEKEIIMVFLNLGKGGSLNHPIHMHGHTFEVLKMAFPKVEKDSTGIDTLVPNEDIQCNKNLPNNESNCNNAYWRDESWNDYKLIPGINLNNPVRKDTLLVPMGGYAIIRIIADNPGVWFMHCHIDSHMMNGMALMLYEAIDNIPELPNLPTCRSFDNKDDGMDGESKSRQTRRYKSEL
ncbi:uncharacterized protein LOC133193118 [Saccostrea echinata]|uniref:uncharacterized protein LOC133193118 n=1 Tax=Saccostrea echinata TaxID=191078 RepID=UPI002A835D0A|nr:uncharacterized protein LOC133193118 [Saccostrea echinata]